MTHHLTASCPVTARPLPTLSHAPWVIITDSRLIDLTSDEWTEIVPPAHVIAARATP